MILGVIPARKGSKGIENKNIYPLCGKPLIEYTFEAARNSNLSSVLFTTDDIKILNKYYGGIERPSDLCQDDTPMVTVIQHAVKEFEKSIGIIVDAVMVLQPTSPLRTKEDINKAIEVFNQNNRLSLYSGYYMGIKQKHKVYDKHTQAPHFQRNGAIFIAKRCLLDSGELWSSDVIQFEMPESRSVDIDNLDQMYIAESILKNPREVSK